MGSPEKDKEGDPTPISATHNEPSDQGVPPAAAAADKEPSPEGRERKRKRVDAEEISLQKQLIEAMERNGRLLSSQLEIQNTNSQLDREQRKDQANSLFAVLNKLADAMVRIADKL
ncbi:hypothetical protein L1987_11861 [Smallanthus sonchifolius]|uniref:Uncharacterized protein n=1 Tax=Smallanthus sonchifolius TaxID=185202 RepID=A0ACB9JD09_9ASTR|nr:hypothetical protein L1987_11861 [Smallanthus sonchifolius]